MTDKLELKSSHEVVYTVDVADVESIFYCKPTDPDILTVLMKDGKRLYCDEVCTLQEETQNDDLEEAAKKWLNPKLDKSYANYGETKMMELTHFDGYNMLDAIEFGAELQKKHLWKDAQGDDLPEYEREVVVFTQNFPDNAGIMMVAYPRRL